MIDIIGELLFYMLLFQLFMKSGTMLAVTVGISLLEFGIQADDMIGNLAKFIMRKRLRVGNPVAILDILSESVEPHYMLSDTPGHEIA